MERSNHARQCIQIPQDCQVNIRQTGKQIKTFFLDHVFRPDAEQELVYDYTGRPLMTEILKGYNGTMFAYGQTGSGKTHTMQGDIDSERFMGLIPRMINAIFDGIMESQETEYTIKVSYIEIYLENIRDLLDPANDNLKIRESKAKGIYIQGVTSPYVGSSDEILGLMEEGGIARACASTRMNDTSSRSHAVFIFRLIGANKVTQTKKMSKLMMVDLAGSEKTRKTQATGKRLDEAKQINKSLSCLGYAINALTTGKRHVPYRNSKLTRLLSDSLGGNSKTCIIVTCSPVDWNIEETISTLRFGVNCKRVKNTPMINEELSIAEYKSILEKNKGRESRLMQKIASFQSQVDALKKALVEAGGNVEEALKDAGLSMAEAMELRLQKENSGVPNNPASLGAFSNKRRISAQVALASYKTNAEYMMLKERVDELEKLYNEECEEKERYMDEAADARCELEEAQQRIKEIEGEKLVIIEKKKLVDEEVKKITSTLGEYRLTMTKLELFQKESKLQIERYREDIGQLSHHLNQTKQRLQRAEIRAASAIDHLPFTDDAQQILEKYNPGILNFGKEDDLENIEKNYQDIYKRLLQEMQRNRELMNNYKEEDVKRGTSERERNTEMLKLTQREGLLSRKVQDLQEEAERREKTLNLLHEREKKRDKLMMDWRNKFAECERASVLINYNLQRARKKFKVDFAQKELELSNVKMMLIRSYRQKRKKNQITGRPSNVRVPIKNKIVSRRMTKA